MSLLEFLLSLLGDSAQDVELQQDFARDPYGTLKAAGLEDLSADDVHDALVLVQDNQTVDFGDTEYNTGGNTIIAPSAPAFAAHQAAHGEHVSAVEYLQTYVTNTEVLDQDTVLGSPVKQVIHAGDDVNQVITTTTTAATGAGAVAAGDDISRSTLTTGDGNAVGSANVVGDGNATAFGNGDVNHATISGTTVSDGSALSVGGLATGSQTTTNSGNTTTTETTNTTEVHDSFNTDVDSSYSSHTDSHDVSNDNVGNTDHVLSHNDVTADVAL